MENAQNSASRMVQIGMQRQPHPEGLTRAEIPRCLQNLPISIPTEDDGCRKIDRTADLINVRLNLQELLAGYLAARLMATQMVCQNPHAAGALRKVGTAMRCWDTRKSMHVMQVSGCDG